jgi:hypothetical protein
MHKAAKVVTGLILTSALIGPRAFADKGDGHGHGHGHHKACKEDMKKFCGGKHGPEKKACVEQNKSQFSQACQEAMAKHEHHEEAAHTDQH